ncbi:DUF4142 domain-containing protein [Flavobacterium sp. I3-2]|uniref:DUF4142 domain-containing protein n=1 Tax=Flavobacterium sp. I3-2 TaxID=2748319 RepID=UPI0015B2E9F6|nr:DUF4142 domain-containing protein [Flavobacterium sp. I3-2]
MIKYNLKLIGGSVFLLASLFFVSCQKDNNSNQGKPVDQSKLSEAEKKNNEIIQNLLDNESFFTQATALGKERASKAELKDFSTNANDVHSKNLEKIKTICTEKGIQVPEKLSKDLNDKLYKLTVSNNADFDNYYYQSLSNDYKVKIDSFAKFINENTYQNAQDILIEVSSVYSKNLEQLEKAK